MKSKELLVITETVGSTKELKPEVPLDIERNIKLKNETQKTDVINQSDNIIKKTSTLTRFCNVLLCNLFN